MKTINLVTVSPETRRIIKKQVISLIKKGKKQIEIAETVGISPQAVKRISSAYKKAGTACLREKKRGRKLGEKRLLTSAQEQEIYHITPAVKYRRFYLLKFPSAALLSIVVVLATTHSSALQMKIYST